MRWLLVILLCSCTVIESNPEIKSYTCPSDDCAEAMYRNLKSGTDIVCVFYALRDEKLIDLLAQKNSYVIIEDKNVINKDYKLKGKKDTPDRTNHNKFCVIDSRKVIMGSYNPTNNPDHNLILVLESEYLAKKYSDAALRYSKGKTARSGRLIQYNDNTLVRPMFCPGCRKEYVRYVNSANKSIDFYFFSFTDPDVADALIKAERRGVKIQGVIEAAGVRTNYNKLKEAINISLDKEKEQMHHKTIIIDEEIVITGSMNPTLNGFDNNDENYLIIHNRKLADKLKKSLDYLVPS